MTTPILGEKGSYAMCRPSHSHRLTNLSESAATSHPHHDRPNCLSTSKIKRKGVRPISEFVKKANELKEPMSERELTTREKIILLEASKLHGARFPPWTSPPLPSEFGQLAGQPQFM